MPADLPFEQDLSRCFRDDAADADARLDAAGWQAALAAAAPVLERLKANEPDGVAPLMALPARRDDLPALEALAADWRGRFARVVLLGTGGSSLGARALAALAPLRPEAAPGPDLVVPYNLDPDEMARVLAPDALDGAGFLVISKSGGTAETLSQALAGVAALKAAGATELGQRFVMVSDPGDSPLRQLAAELGAPVLDHDPGVGGRYSVLSVTGLLPALMLGLDAAAVREGAAAVLDATLAAERPEDAPPAAGAALAVALARRGVSQSVLLSYATALGPLGLWYRQLWAESLGKQGRGTTPLDALGPVDQHSQLQLWLDGPADKLFTVLTTRAAGRGPAVDAGTAEAIGAGYLGGHAVGDLVAAMQAATMDTLAANGRPVRELRLDAPDARTLGALFMQFMLETVLAAGLLGVPPFGQPAVEEGKRLARRYLSEGAP